ncbi:hypothetical protein CQ12_40940 [Bradyrhizobium jicamae]|uniref:Transposase n=1 Tax=Bradyrhizobium jicamae TaxID=280332 RepID=A0A0R3LMJ6_9BRAD|nr:hypothetical protein [Bradyrhizobium jicamae]KRR07021.1 hypothetical protein CQ12_40940 [Bradyrhizobium jicamae]
MQIAMLGGYLGRTRDPPPGNIVVWHGLTKLQDVAFGITIGSMRCGQSKVGVHLCLKRLEKAKFCWPRMNPAQLNTSCFFPTAKPYQRK